MCWIWKNVFHDDNVDNDDIEDGGGDDNEDDLSSYNATMAMVIMMFMRMTAIIFPVTTRVLATKVVQVEGIGQRGRSRFDDDAQGRWMMIFGQKGGSRYKL